MWSWVGLVYQGIYFSQINAVAKVFAAAFLMQVLLFALPAALSCRGAYPPVP